MNEAMRGFREFRERFQPVLAARPADPGVVEALTTRIPPSLRDAWAELGWGGFGKGKLWLTDPAELEIALELFLKQPTGAIAFARTGFGNVYYWREDGIKLIDVHYGKQYEVVSEIDDFICRYLLSEEAFHEDMMGDLHDEAVGRLGPPAPEETFAFLPPLAMGGGEPSIDLVQRVKWREHLAILAGVHFG